MVAQSQPATTGKGSTPRSLILSGIRNFVIGAIVLGVLLCLLAGTFEYWQGWAFAVLFVGLTTQQGIYLAIKDPELLERRKNVAAEGESTAQKIFLIIGLLSGLGQMALSALDHRFGWSQMPVWVSVAGYVLLVLSFYVYYLVFRVNSYTASSIQVFEGQKVISTGLYALVRHPKYVGDLFLVVGVPLALGSWWGLTIILLTIGGLAWRILDEEKLLKKDLPGYVEYTQKVQYRLVPHIW